MRTEDGCIIQRCFDGEPEAFGIIVDKYREGVYSFIYAKLGNFHDAQDVAQEVFVQAYQDLRTLRRWESFAFWLYRIASARCKMWLRARSRRVDSRLVEDQSASVLANFSINAYREDKLNESVRESLDLLPDVHREVLVLHYFSGMNSNEMARALGISPTAVRKRLSRARAQLKEEIVAMMGTAFEGQRLPVGFTIHVMEAAKRIKINPTPRTAGLPWGLALATGIILAILSIGSHLNLSHFMKSPLDSTLSGEMAAAEVGEIPVNILNISRMPVISSKQGNDYGGAIMLPYQQNAVLMAPRGDLPEEPAARLGKGTLGGIAYSPDGQILAVACGIGIQLYDTVDLNEIALLQGYSYNGIAFSPDGRLLAAAGNMGNEIHLWDIQGKNQVGVLKGHTAWIYSVIFSPDGKMLVSGSGDETVRLWDVEEQRQVGLLQHGNYVYSVAFSPDGEILASLNPEDKAVYLWDVEEKKQVDLLQHENQVNSIAFSPDGELLALGSSDKVVRLWDIQEQKQIGLLLGHTGAVGSVAFNSDGKILASGSVDKTIRLWDVQEQKQIGLLRPPNSVRSVAFGPDGKTLASLSPGDKTVRLWNVEEQEQTGLLQGYTDPVMSVAFSPDGKMLASGGSGRTICLWDVAEQKQVGELQGDEGGHLLVAFRPGGEMLASGGWYRGEISLWNVQKQEKIGSLQGHIQVMSIAFSADGKLLASGGGWEADSTVRLWDVEEQTQVGSFGPLGTPVHSVAFSPDGEFAVSGPIIWTVEGQKEVGHLEHERATFSAAFSPDGKLLAIGDYGGGVNLWDFQKQERIARMKRHTDCARSVAFSPDGWWLASASWDGTVRIWDVQTQEQVGVLEGHTSAVNSVAFSPGGKWLASGSSDGTVLIWEMNLPVPPGRSVEPTDKQLGTWGEVKKTELLQNFPNPFNPETWIPFSLSEPKHVKISIYTSTGQLVRTLDLGQKPSGAYLSKEKAAYWDGRNETGETVTSDVYFYSMEAGEYASSRKMIIVR